MSRFTNSYVERRTDGGLEGIQGEQSTRGLPMEGNSHIEGCASGPFLHSVSPFTNDHTYFMRDPGTIECRDQSNSSFSLQFLICSSGTALRAAGSESGATSDSRVPLDLTRC